MKNTKEKIKKKNEKSKNLFLLTFFSFLFTLFSCSDPFTDTAIENPPEGYGSFSLSVENPRTILPDRSPLSNFAVYKLDFTVASGGEGENKTECIAAADLTTTSVILKVGTYNLTVSAYLAGTVETPSKLAARGTYPDDIEITSGTMTSKEVTLKALNNEGSGTFSWNINISADDVTSAVMVITPQSGPPVNITLSPGVNSNSQSLAAGMYNITITLRKEESSIIKEESVWNEILYIYGELTSSYSPTFDNDYFYRVHYDVEFNCNGGSPNIGKQSVMHGGKITEPVEPTKDGHAFGGWFKDNPNPGSGDSPYDFNTEVYNDFTLYARWIDNSPSNPYIVDSITKLGYVGKGTANPPGFENWTLTAHYRQDIDIMLPPPNAGQSNWTRIGTGSGANSFTGSYNGGGHTITGLRINTNSGYQGMFGYIGADGKVENLGLIDVNITSSAVAVATGGIVGCNDGTIQNCYVTGNITGTTYVGGIAGENSENSGSSTIQNCYFSGSVTGRYYIGGITGANDVTIQNCFAAGSVIASGTDSTSINSVGGIVGNSWGTIRNCVALNEIVTNGMTPANIGRIQGNTNGTRQNNYAWSRMTVKVINNPVTTTSAANGIHGADITAADAKDYTWWENATGISTWDFNTVWQWNGTSGMPSLRGVGDVQEWPTYLVDPPANPGDGLTEGTAFKVWNEQTLRYVGRGTANPLEYQDWTPDAYYIQIANITLNGEWITICSNSAPPFTGSYDGDGHTITGLAITGNTTSATGSYRGMFGYIGTNGRVENLGLINVNINITSNDNITVGGIAGYNYFGGTIQNCYVTGSVTNTCTGSSSACTGGIAGANMGGIIQNCYVTSNVTGTWVGPVGGIVGMNDRYSNDSNSGIIQKCYVTGSVTGSSSVGGIVGENFSTIQNCYTTGNVSSTASNVGGIAGDHSSVGGSIIQNCYATGSVSGRSGVGGIAGGNRIVNCIALNKSVTITETNTNVKRVGGYGLNRYAWSGMSVRNGSGTVTADPENGGSTTTADITAEQAKTQTSWTDAGRWDTTTSGAFAWDFTNGTGVWVWNANGMPSLRGVGTTQPWPDHLDN